VPDSPDAPRDANQEPPRLTPEERLRYARQLVLSEVGVDGQQRLKAAKVLIVGAGGLGSPTAMYLVAAGVGTVGLVDNDLVDVTNLQRQLLYDTRALGRPKLDVARDRLIDLNPHVRVVTHATWLSSSNALDIVRDYDIVVDGTDNFATRYLVNDACVLLGKPNVHGSVFQFDGQASVFATADGPCYRCLYPEPPPAGMVPSCAEGGVLGVLPGLIGTIQATETLKLILGVGDTLAGRLLMIDALAMQTSFVRIARDPQCPACGTRTITALIDYDEFCGVPGPAATASFSLNVASVPEISPSALRARLARGDEFDLIDVREPWEAEQSRIAESRLLPLGTLQGELESLDRTQDIVVVCRSGKRSADAARRLQAAGFVHVQSLAGGMLAWEQEL
jgi:adenylyltransferase/sulfurtransferase